jgi:hypothetical protein
MDSMATKKKKSDSSDATAAASAAALKVEIQSLRSNFELIIEKYSLNVKAFLDELIGTLDQKGMDDDAKPLPDDTAMEQLAAGLRNLKLKPGKGRAKDVRRIQRAIENLKTVFDL